MEAGTDNAYMLSGSDSDEEKFEGSKRGRRAGWLGSERREGVGSLMVSIGIPNSTASSAFMTESQCCLLPLSL